MQQFYYLAVLFVAGGIGSALIVAADLRTRRQPMRIMESVWVLTALWASFFGLWAYYAFGRATRHMPVQNNGTGKQKDSAKISEPAKGGGIGENGNERKVGSAGQETENRKPGTGRRKDLSVAGTDPWKVSEPEPAMNMPEPAMTGMQMENGTTTEADGAEDMPGMKGTAGKTDTADKADIPGMTNRVDMPGMADRADMPGMTNEPNMSGTMEGMDGMGNMPGMKGRPRWAVGRLVDAPLRGGVYTGRYRRRMVPLLRPGSHRRKHTGRDMGRGLPPGPGIRHRVPVRRDPGHGTHAPAR